MKKFKTIVSSTFLLLGMLLLTCCESSTTLSKDPKVKSGKLENGFQYYIRENHYDKSKAALRLVVKAGSSLEREDQRGLAHFVEHMVFRGTKNFSDGEVIKYLESIGASFGADTNAYTSFDETVYHLDIPLDEENSIDQALQILADFSSNALFENEFVEKEKNVVLDELRLRLNTVCGRVTKKKFEFFMEGTRYANRLPGGSMEVVKECSRDDLVEFYKKWYRPENMAIIAVGDFDQSQVFSKIEKMYSTFEKSPEPLEFPDSVVPELQANRSLIIKDPEMIISSAHMSSLSEYKPVKTKEDIREDLILSIAIGSLNKRYKKLTESDSSPFMNASFSTSNYCRGLQNIDLVVTAWEAKEDIAVTAAMKEFFNLASNGISNHEFEEKVANFKTSFKTHLENKDKQKNAAYVTPLISEFLDSSTVFSTEDEVKCNLEILETLTCEEINDYIKGNHFEGLKWSLILSAPEEASLSDESELTALMEMQDVNDYEKPSEVEMKPFDVVVKSKPGKIVESDVYEATGIEKLTLSNGLVVYLKKSDLKENIIDLHLFADGGIDSFDESKVHSAGVATQYASRSGLNGLTSTELNSALSGKNAQINYNMALTDRSITGSCSNEDSETAFKLIYAFLNHKHYRDSSWDQLQDFYKEVLKTKDRNPEVRFNQEAIRLANSNHFMFEDPDLSKMSKLDAKSTLDAMFTDVSKFTLVVVGDFDANLMKKHIETYLSYEQSVMETKDKVITSFDFPEGIVEKTVEGGLGNKSQTFLAFPVVLENVKGSKEDYRILHLAAKTLNQRLREKIRMDSGETYNISASLFSPFYPKIGSSKIFITFSCDPSMQEKVLEEVKQELALTNTKILTDEELATAKEIYRQGIKTQDKSLSGISSKIRTSLMFNDDLNVTSDIDADLEKISKEKVDQIFTSLINLQNYVSVALKSRS